jgi:hypothetical protein
LLVFDPLLLILTNYLLAHYSVYEYKELELFKNFIVFLMVIFTVKSYSADVLNHVGVVTQVVAFPHSYGSYSVDAKGLLAIYVAGQPRDAILAKIEL